MDELTIYTSDFGFFQKGAYFREVAALFNPETWQSFDENAAEALDWVGLLHYPLEITMASGEDIVYDMDEASARKMMELMKKHLGAEVQNITLQKRTRKPVFESSFMMFGCENFIRVFDQCVFIQKTKSADARGGLGDLVKLGMLAAGIKQGTPQMLFIPYFDVRQVVLEESTRFKGPVLTVLRKSKPGDSAATFFDVNDRVDCWAFDKNEEELARSMATYIRNHIEED